MIDLLTIAFLCFTYSPSQSETVIENELKEYKIALEESRIQDKPLLILFTSDECANNIKTNVLIEESEATNALLKEDYIFLKLVVTRENAKRLAKFEIDKFNMNRQPYYVITDHTERIIDTSGFIPTEEELLKFLKGGLVLH